MFTDAAFEVDKSSKRFKELHPEEWEREKDERAREAAKKRAKEKLWSDAFAKSNVDGRIDGASGSEGESSDGDEEGPTSHRAQRRMLKAGKFGAKRRKSKGPDMYEARDGTDFERLQKVTGSGADGDAAAEELRKRHRPLGKRAREEAASDKGAGQSYADRGIRMHKGAREMTFTPSSGRGKKEGRGKKNEGGSRARGRKRQRRPAKF
jgi:hypothetical protein